MFAQSWVQYMLVFLNLVCKQFGRKEILFNQCGKRSNCRLTFDECLKLVVKSWIIFFRTNFSKNDVQRFFWLKSVTTTRISKYGEFVSFDEKQFTELYCLNDWLPICKHQRFWCIMLIMSTNVEYLIDHHIKWYTKYPNWCTAIQYESNFESWR